MVDCVTLFFSLLANAIFFSSIWFLSCSVEISRVGYFGEVGRDISFEEVDRGEYFGELDRIVKQNWWIIKS